MAMDPKRIQQAYDCAVEGLVNEYVDVVNRENRRDLLTCLSLAKIALELTHVNERLANLALSLDAIAGRK